MSTPPKLDSHFTDQIPESVDQKKVIRKFNYHLSPRKSDMSDCKEEFEDFGSSRSVRK